MKYSFQRRNANAIFLRKCETCCVLDFGCRIILFIYMTNHEAFMIALNRGIEERQVFNKREVTIEIPNHVYVYLTSEDIGFLGKNGITVKEKKQ